jgi:hypothetical protein
MTALLQEATPGADEACSDEPEGIPDPPLVIPALSIAVLTITEILYVGANARFVALNNGVQLEVKNSAGEWIVQQEFTEE